VILSKKFVSKNSKSLFDLTAESYANYDSERLRMKQKVASTYVSPGNRVTDELRLRY
jgi:hypothetical protein